MKHTSRVEEHIQNFSLKTSRQNDIKKARHTWEVNVKIPQ
jgi:hypothetical protein